MKKLLALLLLLMLPCLALAEAAAVTPLPIEDAAGPAADEACYTEDGYEDASLTVKMERIELDDSVYNVARIRIADPSQLRTAVTPKNRTNKISTIARDRNAVVAIGGDYYSHGKKGYVVRMGEVIRSKNPYETLDMLLTDANGDFHIIRRKRVNEHFTEELEALVTGEIPIINVFNFGPALVIDGELQEIPDNYEYNPKGKEPRCAIGQTGPLEYLLVVVDGRRNGSKGVTMAQLARFMADQGCVQAFNLDGGNSSLMVFHGENYSDKTFAAERSVSDIIYFATAVRPEE